MIPFHTDIANLTQMSAENAKTDTPSVEVDFLTLLTDIAPKEPEHPTMQPLLHIQSDQGETSEHETLSELPASELATVTPDAPRQLAYENAPSSPLPPSPPLAKADLNPMHEYPKQPTSAPAIRPQEVAPTVRTGGQAAAITEMGQPDRQAKAPTSQLPPASETATGHQINARAVLQGAESTRAQPGAAHPRYSTAEAIPNTSLRPIARLTSQTNVTSLPASKNDLVRSTPSTGPDQADQKSVVVPVPTTVSPNPKAPQRPPIVLAQPLHSSTVGAPVDPFPSIKPHLESDEPVGANLATMRNEHPSTIPAANRTALPPTATPHTIALQIAQLAQTPAQHGHAITLNPEELGAVRLALHTQDMAVHVAIAVERPETLDLFRRNLLLLETEIRSLGYDTISFDLAGGQTSHQDTSSAPFETPETPSVAPDNPEHQTRSHPPRNGHLDLRI